MVDVGDSAVRVVGASVPPADLAFGRFEVLEELGEGGFGRVLLCFDHETRSEVALKELRRFGADALLRFKSEFRQLRDVSHPNLVRLGELFEGDGRWAFSLEYVPGHDFLSWVRPPGRSTRFDERRLRAALVQLVQGLSALHAMNLLHRDVKPANVRVTPEGRVVLLDFGLVAQLDAHRDSDDWGLGTIAYMAPEQARRGPVGPAADWYALGALLYESLTGELPFEGSALQVLQKKESGLPPSPSRLDPSVPRDLEELCLGLLLADPAARRNGDDVLRVLGAESAPSPVHSADIFVGRGVELGRLLEAFKRTRERGLSLVIIEGESGIGKSALMRRFAEGLESGPSHPLVLGARCHAAEQVAYKAFDGCVDQLVRFLRGLDSVNIESVLPERPELLPLLFPALRGVPAIQRAERLRGPSAPPDRFLLFQAFAGLLAGAAAWRPLVLQVDDLQWSDLESLLLLEHLLENREMAPLLIVATQRPLAADGSELTSKRRALLALPNVTRLTLSPLREEEARQLGAALLGKRADDSVVQRLGHESSGHPLFLAELARGSAAGDDRKAAPASLDEVILRRVQRLSPLARSVLEVLALEAAPTPHRLLGAVANTTSNELSEALASLRAGRLIVLAHRTHYVTYHDRVRESVLAAIEPELQVALHRRLAEAWEQLGRSEPARLARHWLRAGESSRALPWLERAAGDADQKGAYEHAADLYRTMLEQAQVQADAARRSALQQALGDVLARAGRFVDAAAAYDMALAGADGAERASLLVRMAEQLLRAGSVRAGLDAAERACEAAGLSWAGGTASAIARLVWHRAWLRMTRFDGDARDAVEVAPRHAQRLEMLWRLGHTLMWADMARGLELNARHLRLALRTGSARHIALGLHLEAISVAVQEPSSPRLVSLRRAASAWATRVQTPELEAFARFTDGAVDLFQGRPALESFLVAEKICREKCPGEAWLLSDSRASAMGQLFQLSRFREFARNGRQWLDEALHRGDRAQHAALSLIGDGYAMHLMEDRPDLALAQIDEAIEPWRATTFGIHHIAEIVARSIVHTYEGGAALSAYWQVTWPRVRNTLVAQAGLPSEVMRICRTLGALHLAFAQGAEPDAAALRTARELARGLSRARTMQGRGLGAVLLAQLAFVAGDGAEALRQAERARELRLGPRALPNDFADLVSAALEGPEAYRAREEQALAVLRDSGWVAPERMLRGWFPVLPALRAAGEPRP